MIRQNLSFLCSLITTGFKSSTSQEPLTSSKLTSRYFLNRPGWLSTTKQRLYSRLITHPFSSWQQQYHQQEIRRLTSPWKSLRHHWALLSRLPIVNQTSQPLRNSSSWLLAHSLRLPTCIALTIAAKNLKQASAQYEKSPKLPSTKRGIKNYEKWSCLIGWSEIYAETSNNLLTTC